MTDSGSTNALGRARVARSPRQHRLRLEIFGRSERPGRGTCGEPPVETGPSRRRTWPRSISLLPASREPVSRPHRTGYQGRAEA